MGIMDFLFGEEPSQEIKPTTKLSPEQQRLFKLLEPALREGLGEAGPASAGSSLAATSLEGLEQAALGLIAGPENVAKGKRELGGILDRGPTDFEDFFRGSVRDPLREEFDDVREDTRRRFAGSGNLFSGERVAAERDLTKDFAENLGRRRAETSLAFREQDTNDKLRALGLIPGFETFGIDALSKTAGVGEDVRSRRINEVLAALGLDTQENIVFNNPGSAGAINSFLGGSGGGAIGKGIAGLVF